MPISVSESHLLQMRGLKRNVSIDRAIAEKVASFTDAWIETLTTEVEDLRKKSHLLQMRGLKLLGLERGRKIF